MTTKLRTLTYVVKMDVGDGKEKAKDFRVTLKTMEQDAAKASTQVDKLAKTIGQKYATNVKTAIDETRTVKNEILSAAREANRAERNYNRLATEYKNLTARTGKTAEAQEKMNALNRLGVGATLTQKKAIIELVKAQQAQVKATNKTQKSMRGLRGQAQNLGWQLQDVAVQAQMGTDGLIILGQQGSQLASGFGATGALIGAGIAVSAAAIGVLTKTSGAAKIEIRELAETSAVLAENFDKLNKHQKELLTRSLQENFKEKTKESNALQIKVNELTTSLINAKRAASGRFLEKMLGSNPEKINAELVKVKATLTALGIERDKLLEQLKDPSGKKEEDTSANKEKADNLNEYISSLAKSALLYNATAQEISNYELSVMGASDAQIEVANALNDVISKKEADAKATKKAAKEIAEANKQIKKDSEDRKKLESKLTDTGKLSALQAQYKEEQRLLVGNQEALLALEERYNKDRLAISGTFWEKYAVAAQDNLGSFDDQVSNSLDRFSSGFGEAVGNAVFESDNLGDAMANIFKDVGKNMVAFFAEWAAQKMMLWVLDQTLNKSASLASATAMTLNAQATSIMAGLNAFSSTAAIPIVGAALAPAAATAAVAATQPMAATVASLAFAGVFDQGGYIPSGSAGIVSEYGDELVGGTMVYNGSPNSLKVTGREDTAKMSSNGVNVGGITINSSGNASPNAIARSVLRVLKKGSKRLDNAVFASTNRGRKNGGKQFA